MKKEILHTQCQLGSFTLKNRICIPPLVVWEWSDESGKVVQEEMEHYQRFVAGGAGLVFQEATSVCPEGRLTNTQLGIWEDAQLEGLKNIVQILHNAKMPAIVQLSYAGLLAADNENRVSPSAFSYMKNGKSYTGRELSIQEIQTIEKQFISAAQRAQKAGYDGIELHCCHGYLLGEFLNKEINKRTDIYCVKNRLLLQNIIQGIRKNTSPDFLIGCRMGAFEPELQDGIENAKWLERQGVDVIDAYLGCSWVEKGEVPADFPFSKSVFGAAEIKKEVSIPVIAIGNISSGEEAAKILETTGVDMVAIGRGSLVNPNWTNDVFADKNPGKCLNCKECFWKTVDKKCPGRILNCYK